MKMSARSSKNLPPRENETLSTRGRIRPNQTLKIETRVSVSFSGLLPNSVACDASDPIGPSVRDFGIELIVFGRGTCRHQNQQGQNEQDRFHLNSIPWFRLFRCDHRRNRCGEIILRVPVRYLGPPCSPSELPQCIMHSPPE